MTITLVPPKTTYAVLLLVGFLAFSPAVFAAGKPRRVPTLGDAKQLAQKVPGDILVLVTGNDWNATSVKFKREVINSPAFAAAMGDELILVEIDMPENDPEGKKAALYHDANDLHRYVFRTPLIGLYDANGRDFGQLDVGLEKMSVDEVVTAIRQLIELRKQRDQLWAQANQAKGAQRANLLGQGLAVIQFGWGIRESYHPHHDDYQPVLEELKDLDPQDTSGWLGRFSFDPYKLLTTTKEMGEKQQHAAALTVVEDALKNKRLTPEYRQRALAVKYSVYFNWKGHDAEALNVLHEIEKIDNKSLMGIGAQRWATYLTGPVDLEYGWRKQNVQANFATWEIPISEKMGRAGFYRLKLAKGYFGTGSNNLVIRSLKIEIDGKTVWSVDKEFRPTFEEIIELPELGTGKAILKIDAKGDGGTDSYGNITLEPYYLRPVK
jgi:hypothetical protein